LKGDKYVPEKEVPIAEEIPFKVDDWRWEHIQKNRNTMMLRGFVKNAKLRFKYVYGFSSGEEEEKVAALHSDSSEGDATITDINYWDGTVKVRLLRA